MKDDSRQNKIVHSISCVSHKVMRNNKTSTIHIMTDDGSRGYVNLLFENNECIINSLHVDEEYRKQEIGTTLMKESILEALANGISILSLYVIKDSWMHGWYKRLGYSDTNSQCENGYIKMEKRTSCKVYF